MSENKWKFWVYLIKDGERYGFLFGRKQHSDAPIEYKYFCPNGPDGLSPDDDCLQLCKPVWENDPSSEAAKFLHLLKRCVIAASQNKDSSGRIPCKEIPEIGNDPAEPFRRLFEYHDKKIDQLRHKQSPLRKFLVDYSNVFCNSILKLSNKCFHVKAEAFEILLPHKVEERVFDLSILFSDIQEALVDKSLLYLKKQLRSDEMSDYIKLQLEIGRIPRQDQQGNKTFQLPLEMGREWGNFNTDLLLLPGGKYLLSSVSGAGKTTFLRHAQNKILSTSSKLPVFLRAKDLQPLRPINWPRIRSILMDKFDQLASQKVLKTFLDIAWNKGRLVLIVDALDNLGTAGANCNELISELIELSGNNTLIMAGRPTVTGWIYNSTDIEILRLRQFDDKSCQKYFGDHYQKAHELCKGNANLLKTPMLAYMIKSLCDKPSGKFRSLWDLYSAFLKYILQQHPTNIQDVDHQQWAHDITESLGAISYHAIDQKEPQWTIISESTIHSALKSLSDSSTMSIDTIPSAGIVDFIDIDENHTGISFVFSHQSFQEFLAANWISKDESRIEHVLEEYWNPKWKEVIKFLAGTDDGERIIESLYPDPSKDNPIHSRLFFAAECAEQCPKAKEIQNNLFAELKDKLDEDPFRSQCLIALGHLTINDAEELLWTILHQGNYRRSYDREQLKAIESSYRRDRLDYILQNNRIYEDNNAWLLIAWGNYITGKKADVLIDTLASQPSVPLKFQALFPRISQNLSKNQLNKLLKIYTRPKRVAWHVLRGLSDRLDSDDITHIIETAFAMYSPTRTRYSYYVLEQLHQFPGLQKNHITQVLKRFFDSNDILEKQELVGVLRDNNRWLDSSDISSLISAILNKNSIARHLSLKILEGILHCARPNEQEAIVCLLDDADIKVSHQSAITIASLQKRLSETLQKRLLNISKDDTRIAFQVIRYLRQSLTRQDIEYFVDQAIHSRDMPNAIECCAQCVVLLSEQEIYGILPRLFEYTQPIGPLFYRTLRLYAHRLQSQHVEMVVDKIERESTGKKILQLLCLVNENTITVHDTIRLTTVLDNLRFYNQQAVYDKLRSIHARRGLLDEIEV